MHKYGIECFIVDSELLKSEAGTNVLNHPTNFRNGFWSLTLLRLFALFECMKKMELDKVLHIELDVKLFRNFPWDCLEKMEFEVSYPLVTTDNGSAALLYLSGIQGLSKMLEEFSRQIKVNPSSTDMSLLGWYKKNHESEVGILPTFPGQTHTAIPWEQGCFDAATLGMFLTGTDPRNTRGWVYLFKNQPDHIAQTPLFEEFSYIQNTLTFQYKGLNYPIYNLHIHSKQPRLFLDSGIRNAIRGNSFRDNEKHYFKVDVFLAAMIRSLIRRFKGKNN